MASGGRRALSSAPAAGKILARGTAPAARPVSGLRSCEYDAVACILLPPRVPCSGQCTCEAGYSSCTAAGDCSTDTNTDNANCGGCGNVCAANPSQGIASAQCVAGGCNVTCLPKYTLCPDGTCVVDSPNGGPGSCGLPGCETFSDNQCSGNNITTPNSFAAAAWQTPPANDKANYLASFQNYSSLQVLVGARCGPEVPAHTLPPHPTPSPGLRARGLHGCDAPGRKYERVYADEGGSAAELLL